MTDMIPVGIPRVYLNGTIVSVEQAKLSVFDRGVLFGDGIYEVIPVYGGRPFRLEAHLNRLRRNLAEVGIAQEVSTAEWEQTVADLVSDHRNTDQSVYLQITRGVAPRDHAYPLNATPTVFAYAQELKPVVKQWLEQGISAVVLEDVRWHRCDIKTTALIANVMLRQQASEQGAEEAILVRDGMATEGSASNLFVVRDGQVITPPKGRQLLPGITRDLVVELMAEQGIDHSQDPISVEILRAAEEIWITSSTREVLAVTRLDDKLVGDGRPGDVFRKVYGLFQDYKRAFRANEVQ